MADLGLLRQFTQLGCSRPKPALRLKAKTTPKSGFYELLPDRITATQLLKLPA